MSSTIKRGITFGILFLLAVMLTAGQQCPGNLVDGDGDDGSADDGVTDVGGDGDTSGTGDGATGEAIIADHHAADAFESIPLSAVTMAKASFRIFYGHTSHGSQIVAGMDLIYASDAIYAYNAGGGSLSLTEDDGSDLGHEGDTDWATTTRDRLDEAGNDFNVVMWSWCGGVSDNTQAGINTYLNTMSQLESEYPGVMFVYMTGHLDGTGESGNLRARNNQIRNYCQANGKVLFDFADIESYDPDGTYYPNGSDWCEWCETWCASNSCPTPGCTDDDECQHSVCFNCYRKGQAFWWMMARLAGWSGE
jgi:hypothetical protein